MPEPNPSPEPTISGPRTPPDPPSTSTLSGAASPPPTGDFDVAPPPPTVPGYEIVGELGRGGMGVVYHARQNALKRPVALKMILAGGCASADAVRRFRGEAEVVARLDHPNVVRVYDSGECGGHPYQALEFVSGGSLGDRLRTGPLPVGEAVQLAVGIAAGVQAAHAAGVVHRDLKPANVLLSPDGVPKVADFGLAKDLGADGATVSGSILGTPAYMAPEQAEGRTREIGPRTDVYALGAILYAMVTGRPPFQGETAMQVLDGVRFRPPVAPSKVRPEVPEAIDAVCLRCLAKDPSDRYPSAADFASDLLRSWEDGPPRRPGRLGRRVGVWCLGVIALSVATYAVFIPRAEVPTKPDGGTPETPPPAGDPIAELLDRQGAAEAVDLANGKQADTSWSPVKGPVWRFPGSRLRVLIAGDVTDEEVTSSVRVDLRRMADYFQACSRAVPTEVTRLPAAGSVRSASPGAVRAGLGHLCRAAGAGDTVVFYYSGAGIEVGDPPRLVLVPQSAADVPLTDPDRVLPFEEICSSLDLSKATLNVVILDIGRTRREGPPWDRLAKTLADSGTSRLSPERLPRSTAVILSTRSGDFGWSTPIRGGFLTASLCKLLSGVAVPEHDEVGVDTFAKDLADEIGELHRSQIKRGLVEDVKAIQTPEVLTSRPPPPAILIRNSKVQGGLQPEP